MIGRRKHRGARAGDTPFDLLVVGLGNPGERYENTRHNVGSDTVRRFVARHGERFRADTRTSASVAELRMDGRRVAAAVPATWMNESGLSVGQLVRRYGIEDWSRLVLVHDELDLPQGRVKVKVGGGLAGHNGLRSVEQHLHTRDFVRVRVGVGKPPGGADKGAAWVLSKVSGATRAELEVACETAADAVEAILVDGVDATMQRVNAG